MVNKKLVVISYCSIFLFIYLSTIAYAVIPTYLNKQFNSNIDLPKSQAINTTVTAVSAIPNNSLLLIVLALVILIGFFIVYSSLTMFGAYK